MHFYEKNIVEIKNEYTTFLTDILTPLLYEGFRSLYKTAKDQEDKIIEKMRGDSNMKNPGVLKIFQNTLVGLKDLNNHQIEKETARIKEKSKCSEWFDDLVKGVVKSNIVLLTYNASDKNCKVVNDKHHENISTSDFVHKCYLVCAREFYNNSELFYDQDQTSISLKRNQRDILDIIRKHIPDAIRRMLPMKIILKEYLKNDYIVDDFKDFNNVPDSQYRNMKAFVARDMTDNLNGFKEIDDDEYESKIIDPRLKLLKERAKRAEEALSKINSSSSEESGEEYNSFKEEFNPDNSQQDKISQQDRISQQDIFPQPLESNHRSQSYDTTQRSQSNDSQSNDTTQRSQSLDSKSSESGIDSIEERMQNMNRRLDNDSVINTEQSILNAKNDPSFQEILQESSVLSRPPAIRTSREDRKNQFQRMIDERQKKMEMEQTDQSKFFNEMLNA
ncbi:MAG: hypothetical protein CMF62_00385 [Magnetococcales bacterium]|nr:hypothetical protein [Magnetococcales bacterium]|tara:strand:- start:23578 stop:24918 length:1341 start_codon:yes stop_codon:yes gene_type:complete